MFIFVVIDLYIVQYILKTSMRNIFILLLLTFISASLYSYELRLSHSRSYIYNRILYADVKTHYDKNIYKNIKKYIDNGIIVFINFRIDLIKKKNYFSMKMLEKYIYIENYTMTFLQKNMLY